MRCRRDASPGGFFLPIFLADARSARGRVIGARPRAVEM